MSMRTWAVMALAAVSLTAASAQTVTYHTTGAGKNVEIVSPFTSGTTTFAGIMNVSLANGPSEMPGSFQAFCVDLQHTVNTGNVYPVELIPLPDGGLHGLVNSGRVAWLYNQHGQSALTNDTAAALQLSIWDILYDGGDGLNSGSFKASANPTINSLANGYLAASIGQTGNATWLRSLSHPKGKYQDMIGPGAAAIPEPGAMALLAAGALPLLGGLRRKAR